MRRLYHSSSFLNSSCLIHMDMVAVASGETPSCSEIIPEEHLNAIFSRHQLYLCNLFMYLFMYFTKVFIIEIFILTIGKSAS